MSAKSDAKKEALEVVLVGLTYALDYYERMQLAEAQQRRYYSDIAVQHLESVLSVASYMHSETYNGISDSIKYLSGYQEGEFSLKEIEFVMSLSLPIAYDNVLWELKRYGN